MRGWLVCWMDGDLNDAQDFDDAWEEDGWVAAEEG